MMDAPRESQHMQNLAQVLLRKQDVLQAELGVAQGKWQLQKCTLRNTREKIAKEQGLCEQHFTGLKPEFAQLLLAKRLAAAPKEKKALQALQHELAVQTKRCEQKAKAMAQGKLCHELVASMAQRAKLAEKLILEQLGLDEFIALHVAGKSMAEKNITQKNMIPGEPGISSIDEGMLPLTLRDIGREAELETGASLQGKSLVEHEGGSEASSSTQNGAQVILQDLACGTGKLEQSGNVSSVSPALEQAALLREQAQMISLMEGAKPGGAQGNAGHSQDQDSLRRERERAWQQSQEGRLAFAHSRDDQGRLVLHVKLPDHVFPSSAGEEAAEAQVALTLEGNSRVHVSLDLPVERQRKCVEELLARGFVEQQGGLVFDTQQSNIS